MFKWKFDKTFLFSLESSTGENVPFSEWDNFHSDYLSQLSIIQELVDNGLAMTTYSVVEIETEDILTLDEIDKRLLGLPSDYPFVIFIEADGILSQGSFKFKYGFFDFVPNGNRLFFNRDGVVLKNTDTQYLLSLSQFKVLDAIEAFNSLPESSRTFQHNLTCFADIKSLSDDVATMLDSFLQSQNVLHPEKIKIDVSFENETLELKPKIDTLKQESLEKAFDLSPTIKPTYNLADENGGTTRVIIDEVQKEELTRLKRNRKISNQELIEDIVENPENYFDDNIIDLAYFSQRVREIGIYKPKFYPFVCPYKSEWIPGFVIKDKLNGDKKIHFKTPVELAEFETERNIAIKEGKTHFTYKNEQISVDDADKIVSIATKQFENPKEPIVKESSTNSDEVLIIKENADLLEYIENNSNPESLQHSFFNIENLKAPIELKEHQIEGVAWLQSLFRENLNGCLLADDMGLGKTLQLLYFIEWHAQNINDDKPYLIVAPVSLLENWESEYKRFFNPTNLELRFLFGATGIDRDFSRSAVLELQRKQLILTNYESLRSYQMNLCAVDYSIVVLDEAQKIKTPGTLVTNVSKALKADFKIAMTGTPVENTLVDLWCIMDFSVPGLLGNAKDFAKNYQKPLSNEDTDIHALGEQLRGQIGVFIKRRLKQDVAKDLPRKNLRVVPRTMPEIQANRYSVEIELAKNEQMEGVERRNQILKSLWAIRDISDHPYLVDNQINMFNSSELIYSSAKLQILIEILHEVQYKSEKAIIFADRKETQKMLQKVIYETFKISPPSIINGDTPSSKQKETSSKLSRQQTIDRFQNEDGFNVIIMSQLAAGVGLNVVGANHVIHYTRHWNPAKEEQATDRAYRIGQTRDVTVYYPMAVFPESFQNEKGERQKSFDEILDVLLSRKKSLASSTLFPSEQSEVRPDEIFDDVFGNIQNQRNNKPLAFTEIEKLNPRLFEAYVASLYTKQGFQVYLTPFANDKGADVVALSPHGNYLIQAKQSQSSVSNDAIQEVVTSKNYYENHFSEKFNLVVLTNNYFGSSATTLSNSNEVEKIDRIKLESLIQNFPVTIQDINRHESQRLQRI
ncbi:SNF2-related protein [Pleomorphovibrio marinus]|uniref:SNF2-related protein n=1 Tax=Pleomorphovibrio marinus TaxID=2164132 RepID=UPI000E0C9DFF|nr:SNF2-related protein [Pleomorphovibrio marinus]